MNTFEVPTLDQLEITKDYFFNNCPVILDDTFVQVSYLGRLIHCIQSQCCNQSFITDPNRVRELALQVVAKVLLSTNTTDLEKTMAKEMERTILYPFTRHGETTPNAVIELAKARLEVVDRPDNVDSIEYLKEQGLITDSDIAKNIEYFSESSNLYKKDLLPNLPFKTLDEFHPEVLSFYINLKHKQLSISSLPATFIRRQLDRECALSLLITLQVLSESHIKEIPEIDAFRFIEKITSEIPLQHLPQDKVQALTERASLILPQHIDTLSDNEFLSLGRTTLPLNLSIESSMSYLKRLLCKEDLLGINTSFLQKIAINFLTYCSDQKNVDDLQSIPVPGDVLHAICEHSSLDPNERAGFAKTAMNSLLDSFSQLDSKIKCSLIGLVLEESSATTNYRTGAPIAQAIKEWMTLEEVQLLSKGLDNHKQKELYNYFTKDQIRHLHPKKRKMFTDIRKAFSL